MPWQDGSPTASRAVSTRVSPAIKGRDHTGNTATSFEAPATGKLGKSEHVKSRAKLVRGWNTCCAEKLRELVQPGTETALDRPNIVCLLIKEVEPRLFSGI